jgi:predicted RNA-binding Zn-ribbon protein involved in translation (DUF1610 family)
VKDLDVSFNTHSSEKPLTKLYRDMSNYIEKQCSECGQQLRFPKHVGGVVMACPSCGKRFSSDFKLGRVGKKKHCRVTSTIFELPTTLIERLQLYFRRK